MEKNTDSHYTDNEKVDFISELHKKSATHVVQTIAEFLDAESLRLAETVSLNWSKAIMELNSDKLWQTILNTKISTCPMWRHLYNADADLGIDDGITDTLSWLEDINQSPTKHTIRNLYSKFEIAIQEVKNNNQRKNGFMRKTCYISPDNESGDFQVYILKNYVAAYTRTERNGFQIWNRQSLTFKFFTAEEYPPQSSNLNGLVFTITEKTLIYPANKCSFVFINLHTGKEILHSPLPEKLGYDFVDLITVNDGFFCASFCNKQNRPNSMRHFYLWRYTDLSSFIDWNVFQKLVLEPSIPVSIHFDQELFVIKSCSFNRVAFDVRYIACLENRVSFAYFTSAGQKTNNFIYYDGNVIYPAGNTIRSLDLKTGVLRILWENRLSTWEHFHIEISFDSLYAYSLKEQRRIPFGEFPNMEIVTVSSWKLTDLFKPSSPPDPYFRFRAFIPQHRIFSLDPFNLTVISFTEQMENGIKIHQISFMPRCIECSQIRIALIKCKMCLSVKYCSTVCRELDWLDGHENNCKYYRYYVRTERLYDQEPRRNTNRRDDSSPTFTFTLCATGTNKKSI